LKKKIEEDRSTRKRDYGKLYKWKKPPMDSLEKLVGKKKRQVGKAMKMRVK
jgi:hypothetical protein